MDEEALLEQARQITDAGERLRWLRDACGADSELWKRLEPQVKDSAELSDATHESESDLVPPTIDLAIDTHDDEVTKTFVPSGLPPDLPSFPAQYKVLQELGRGGMGIVLKAYDQKLDRFVAIKILAPALAADDIARQRFLREARAAAAVNHPHVVTIFSIEDHHTPSLIMEYVAGQSLAQRAKRETPLPIDEIVRIAMQIADGLSAAHAQGLIHRDIKPANILIDAKSANIKITDFGLARARDNLELTQTGMIAGTPQFMSPEQSVGGEIDERSDLFSLGSVLYTLCTGAAPFSAASALAVLRKVSDEDPIPIQTVRSDVPLWLAQLIAKLLAKSPDDRPQSAQQVLEVLREGWLHLQHPSQFASPTFQPGPPPLHRKPSGLVLGVTVGALVLLAIVGWQFRPRAADLPNENQTAKGIASPPSVPARPKINIPTLPAMESANRHEIVVAAATFLQLGGSVQILLDNDKQSIPVPIKTIDELPDEKWRLNAIGLGNATADDLDVLLPLDHLAQVEMSHSLIPASTMLDRVAHLATIRSLAMNHTRLTSDDVERLLRFPRLYLLNAYAADWNDDDIKKLVQLSNLENVNLGATDITDVGVEAFATLPGLEKLMLAHTRVTDEALQHLQECPSLVVLDVSQTLVTPEGIALFKESKPACEVRAD